jgi:hypothetical protein
MIETGHDAARRVLAVAGRLAQDVHDAGGTGMSGAAFLALWNDLAGGREAEYATWHTREHLPERVAAPGFRDGRRYVAPAHPTHRWFTLYDVEQLDVFETPEYLDLLRNPTPWSASMRGSFRNFLRVPCATLGESGFGLGAALAVLRLPDDSALAALDALAHTHGMVGARLGRRADSGLVASGFRAGTGGSGATDDFGTILLLEALDRAAAERAFAAAAARFLPAGATPLDHGGVYDLAFVFPGRDAQERLAHRRASWA